MYFDKNVYNKSKRAVSKHHKSELFHFSPKFKPHARLIFSDKNSVDKIRGLYFHLLHVLIVTSADLPLGFLTCSRPTNVQETIVRFVSQCNRIFGDIIFTSCPFKLKFSSIISTLQTNSEANNWIRQQMKNFPIYPHCKKCSLSATL